jgi:hypothetical protein
MNHAVSLKPLRILLRQKISWHCPFKREIRKAIFDELDGWRKGGGAK